MGMIFLRRNIKALTVLELLISVSLIGIVMIGVWSLYDVAWGLYFPAEQQVNGLYELQYAAEHIYKYTMQAMGDNNSPAIDVPNPTTLDLNINTNDPMTSLEYSDTTTYSYTQSGSTLLFDNGITQESIVPNITLQNVTFSYSNNILTVSLTGYYKNPDSSVTFYSACYPHSATFR